MNELLIAAIALVLLLIIISKMRKKSHKSPEPVMQAKEIKSANKPILDTEPKKEPVAKPQATSRTEPKSKIVESKIKESGILPSRESDASVPQDSVLKRHFLAHLRAMIESVNLPRPTDSCLNRHYDSLITSETEQCLSNKVAFERLICIFESHKKTLVQQIPQPIKPAEHAESSQPISAETNQSLRPTDSVLRRHYDTMIDNEINDYMGRKNV